ncbi:MAG: LysR family transcriptional regulator [Desulfobacula sp.]|nr:LysR family transcriptional regulator [Desulfobacula sp.]
MQDVKVKFIIFISTMNIIHTKAIMDLYQLRTFFTLAKIKNFTQTAQALFVTQSAVSHAIKKLEDSVDTPLIERKGRRLTLTQAGQTLYRSCEKIFYEIEKADRQISHFKNKRY